MKIGLRFETLKVPMDIGTSSGTLGHALSYGTSDAVCGVFPSGTLAAIAIGNRIENTESIETAIHFGKTTLWLEGIVIVVGSRIGFWGALDPIRL